MAGSPIPVKSLLAKKDYVVIHFKLTIYQVPLHVLHLETMDNTQSHFSEII